MIRFIYVKTEALYNANKANYTNDIVFVEDVKKFYAKGVLFNDFATAISNLKIFSKISDGTNTYSAASNDSTLTVKGSKHITATASTSGLTISDNIVLKQGSVEGSLSIGDGNVIVPGYTSLKSTVDSHTNSISTINGTGDGSISKAVSDAKSEIIGDASEATNTLGKLATKLNTVAETTSATIIQEIADRKTGDSDTLTAAKKYADDLISTAVTSVYKVKGTKATYADLPTSGNVEGDVWNVTAAYGTTPAGTNWVWVADTTKTAGGYWDALGGTVDLSSYVNTVSGGTAVSNLIVSAVTKSGSTLTVAHRSLTASDIPNLAISKITNLQTTLDGKVPTTRTVNGKALSADVTLTTDNISTPASGMKATYLGGVTVTSALNSLYTDTGWLITAAINKLDANEVGGSGKVITTISETSGVISATSTDLKAANVTATEIAESSSSVAVTGKTVEELIKSLATSVAAASGSAAAAVQSVKVTGDSYIVATPTTATTGAVAVTVGIKDTTIATTEDEVTGTLLTTGAAVADYVANKISDRVTTVTASSNSASLTLSAKKTNNTVAITGSLEWVEVSA